MTPTLYPFTFQPIFKDRVWGGRRLKDLYRKPLPDGIPIGESWEISDRPGDTSVIANGPLAGKDLHWLMQNHAGELLGAAKPQGGRFPLLVKVLDAREKLSLQVHPPAEKARGLGGEPKTEMWYVADAIPGAELFVGLKPGVTREQFEQKIHDGTVADCFHRVPVRAGDTMFLPSGRVHAVGAGLVIFEIQQNSDTTYRVFDWNRAGLDGKPRALHIPESLASIDFNDFEPALAGAAARNHGQYQSRSLVDNPLFRVELLTASGRGLIPLDSKLRIVGVVNGEAAAKGNGQSVQLAKGQFCLLPAAVQSELVLEPESTVLVTEA